MFPILVGHADALELAIHHALPAVDTAVHVIFHHILFGGTVQDDQLDRVRWAIFHTQTAARAGRWRIGKDASIA